MKQENVFAKDSANPTFEIKGAYHLDNCLPSLNDLLSAAERHPQAYNRMKRDMEWAIIVAIRRDLKGWKPTGRVTLNITWGEKKKGRKRDYDNIVSAGRKLINDALVKNGTLKDDSPAYLGYGQNTFVYTDKVFVRVEIAETEKLAD